MHITTRGGSKTQKKYAKSMADFCGEKLLGSRLYPKIELRIELVKDLMKKEKIYGEPYGKMKIVILKNLLSEQMLHSH